MCVSFLQAQVHAPIAPVMPTVRGVGVSCPVSSFPSISAGTVRLVRRSTRPSHGPYRAQRLRKDGTTQDVQLVSRTRMSWVCAYADEIQIRNITDPSVSGCYYLLLARARQQWASVTAIPLLQRTIGGDGRAV
jgi:hypothetical protein